MSIDRYILIGQTPVAEPDLLAWGRWFEDIDNRRVFEDSVAGIRVSTVFLGIDHNWFGGPPILFETMAFSPAGESLFQDRCATWTEAEAMHHAAVAQVRKQHSAVAN